MSVFADDIRSGVRQLLRQRGSSTVAVFTLALAIGASTALFSVVDATMLRPLPYPDPAQLVSVYPEETRADGSVSRATASMEDVRFLQQLGDVFSHVAGWGSAFRGRILDGAEPERIAVLHFTEDYLPMHGVKPILGRGFTREDTDPGSPLVALLGYGYWQSRYAGADVLGQTLRLDTDAATIVGVLPAGFSTDTRVATPLRVPHDEFGRRGTGRVSVYARLRPDVTVEQAIERVAARMAGWAPSGGGARPAQGVNRARVTSRLDSALASSQTTITVLASAVGLILLMGCVNVGGLLLARGGARQAELAVRASLGAGRWRLIRQLLTESAVLAIPGALLGVLIAWLSLDALVANVPMRLPADAPVTLNVTVLVATAALLMPTVLLFGLLPAIRLSRVQLGTVLARAGRQGASTLTRRASQALIAAEVALAVVLVVGAGLMIRSFARLVDVDLGFNPRQLLTMDVLPLEASPEAQKAYYTALLQRVRTVSGVQSAGIVDNFSLQGVTAFSGVRVAGQSVSTTIFRATSGYLETIGATLVEGRFPTDAEFLAGARVAAVNESAARAMYPHGPAVGREFSTIGQSPEQFTLVGVFRDIRHNGPLSPSRTPEQVFFPLDLTKYDSTTAMSVVMRVSDSARDLPNRLRQAAQSIGPRVLVEDIRTGETLFGQAVITPRRRLVLLGLLGGLGLVLALVGVFGMTAYAVARRTAEIGVRMAFGARPGQVVATMARDSAVPVGVGAVAGVGGALLATRVIESFLFQTSARDPATLAAVAATLVLAGGVAALVPALRAARVDPALSLRTE